MVQILRILFTYPAFYLLQAIVQRFTLFSLFTLIAMTLFFVNKYVSSNSPALLIQGITKNLQDDVDESVETSVTIKKGDTLGVILRNQKLANLDIRHLIQAAKNGKITSNLRAGQVLTFNYDVKIIEHDEDELNEEQLVLNRMTLKLSRLKSIEFVRKDGGFAMHHISVPLKKLIVKYEATVNSSVMSSLQKAGMNSNNIINLINAYSYQIDFQRQIRAGDSIAVITERFVTPDNEFSHHGKILYASLKTRGTEYNIYSHTPDGFKRAQFFSENGQSIKSTLLRTPVKVVRISGRFGYRKKHPVLGYGAMHRGVDFAGAIGTPIYSAGDGIVQFIGWKSGYGRIIIIKHNRRLSTAYAHASRFAKLKKGSKVEQGDIIAYIGKSGRVTGPHLHYEVRINGKQVNPMKFKSSPGSKLAGAQMSKFNKHKQKMHELRKKLGANIEMSKADAKNNDATPKQNKLAEG